MHTATHKRKIFKITLQHELRLREKIESIGGKIKYNHQEVSLSGSRVTQAVIYIDNEYYVGVAFCNPLDQFSRPLGRVIALGRAFQSLGNATPTEESKVLEALRFEDSKNE